MVRLKNPLHSKSASGRVGQIVYGQLGDTAYARTRPEYITPNPSWNNILPTFSWANFKAGRSKGFVFSYSANPTRRTRFEPCFYYVNSYDEFQQYARLTTDQRQFLNQPAFFDALDMDHYMEKVLPENTAVDFMPHVNGRIWQELGVTYVPICPTANSDTDRRDGDIRANGRSYMYDDNQMGLYFFRFYLSVSIDPDENVFVASARDSIYDTLDFNPKSRVSVSHEVPIRLWKGVSVDEMAMDNATFLLNDPTRKRVWKMIRG